MEHEHGVFEKESEWMIGKEMIQSILEKGMQAYAEKLPDTSNAFDSSEHKLCCIDEGVPFGDVRSAGSAILLEGEDRKAFIEKLKASGIKEVTSHAGCGAAGLYREKMGLLDKTVDEVAIEGAKRMADELGVPYSEHIENLTRPKEFHNARVIYIDKTGTFNPSKVDGFPQGFVVSEHYMTQQQAETEMTIASQIALGDHGFGKKFTDKDPLLVIVIDKKEISELDLVPWRKLFNGQPIRIDAWSQNTDKNRLEEDYKLAA